MLQVYLFITLVLNGVTWSLPCPSCSSYCKWGWVAPRAGRLHLKCDGTHAETRFRISEKRTSPFKWAEASVQSTTGSWGVHISGSNAGYTIFRGSVKSTCYPLHSPVSPSPPLPCVTVCQHILTNTRDWVNMDNWRKCSRKTLSNGAKTTTNMCTRL